MVVIKSVYDNTITEIQGRFQIIGRSDELRKALVCIAAGKHILIEGPVGVGKTAIAEALSKHFGRKIFRIDGDERYTEQKIVGWFDPPLVMVKGYSDETFIKGPLVQAMSKGGFLFINELNRMPEGTQNVLLPAMDEGQAVVPNMGILKAENGFLIIATQNPEEYIGTSRLSEALRDRFVSILLNYQSEEEETHISRKETGSEDVDLISLAVKIVRKTREEALFRRGSSIRGAIDLIAIVNESVRQPINELDEEKLRWLMNWAAVMALSSKVEIREGSIDKTIEVLGHVVDEVLSDYLMQRAAKVDDHRKPRKKK